jgi:hypothetical protein
MEKYSVTQVYKKKSIILLKKYQIHKRSIKKVFKAAENRQRLCNIHTCDIQ